MDEEVDVGQEIEVDESICIICGGSTYQGETISCETCLRWFHFNCVGVTHSDDCVRMEDVPYYCPTCDLKVRKQARQKKPKTPRRTKAKAKPKKSAKLQQSSEIILSRQQSSESAITPNKEGLKLKISLKNTPDKEKSQKSSKKKTIGENEKSQKLSKKRSFIEDLDVPEPQLSEDSDSSTDFPLIIDEIAPRSVKVGRRRPSQRQQGGEVGPGSEDLAGTGQRFGLELRHENIQDLIQTSSKGTSHSLDLEVEEGWDNEPTEQERLRELETRLRDDERKGEEERVRLKQEEQEEKVRLKEEEDRWMAAVEEGNLEKVRHEDSELRSLRDPKFLTARQKALTLAGEGQEPEEQVLQSLHYGLKKKPAESKEDLLEKAIKAQKRREIETEKKEKIKQKTMDTILKKKDSKTAKLLKTFRSQRDAVPKISYVMNGSGALLSYPPNCDYPMKKQVAVDPPATLLCCMCSNAKRYSCSKTGKPLCSLECYKSNLSLRTSA